MLFINLSIHGTIRMYPVVSGHRMLLRSLSLAPKDVLLNFGSLPGGTSDFYFLSLEKYVHFSNLNFYTLRVFEVFPF